MRKLFITFILLCLLGTSLSSAMANNWPPISSNGDINVTVNFFGNEKQRGPAEILMKPYGATCSSREYGNVAFKIVGAPKDWEEKSKNKVVIGLNGTLKSDGIYVQSPYGTGWGQGTPIDGSGTGLYFSASPTGSGDFWAVMGFNTSGWPMGEYSANVFYNNGCRGTNVGFFKFTLPDLNSPKVTCELQESEKGMYPGNPVGLNCISSIELKNVPIQVEVNFGKGWSKLLDTIVSGKSFQSTRWKLETSGSQSVRISSIGVIDQINPFSSEIISFKVLPPREFIKLSLSLSQYSQSGASKVRINWPNASSFAGENIQVLTSEYPEGPWETYKDVKITSSLIDVSVNKPKGVWVKISYKGNQLFWDGESNPVQIVETPVIKCTIPTSGKIDVKINLSCTSDISMVRTEVFLQQYLSSGWVDIEPYTISGKKFQLSHLFLKGGVTKVRVLSKGLQDNYSAFQSNTMSIKISDPPLNSSKWIKEGYAAIMDRNPDVLYRWGISNAFGATGKPVKAKMESFCKKFTVWELRANDDSTNLSDNQKIAARKYWNQGCVTAGMKLKLSNFTSGNG